VWGPYIDSISKSEEKVLTLCKALYDQANNFVGVVGIDVLQKDFQNLLN